MNGFDYDIGIIGAGAGGLTVAAGAAQLGAKTLLIEKEPELGGDCLHFGCVPSKTLIHSAHVYHLLKHSDRYGLPAVELPPVDFARIAAHIREVIAAIQVHDSEERFCGLGAKVVFGLPRFIEDHTVAVNGQRVSARSWVIATGSSPAVPPIPGLDRTPFITNRELFSLPKLPDSMIFLGAGPIGSEMAQAFNRLGSRVTVVDRGGQILGKEDSDLAGLVQAVMAEEGVRFELEAVIESVRDAGTEKEVVIRRADGETVVLRAETLVVAMGRVPNLDGLDLEAAGVAYQRRGIPVDARLRTNRRHIYAVGDVNGGYQFTHAAGYEGGIVVSNAVFRLPRKADYTHLPWCTYTDPELASIGMNEKRAQAAGIDYRVWTEAFRDNDRSRAEVQTEGRIKLLLDERERPLGVQIAGPRAGDLISEWVAVFSGGVKLSTLAGAIHPYPTIGEINKRVAGSFIGSKIFSDRVRKGLKFFFHLKGRACRPAA